MGGAVASVAVGVLGRGLAIAVVASLVVLAVPAGGAAQPSGAGSYVDVGEGDWFYGPVAALAQRGVFAGTDCGEGFCPDEPLVRWQMAVWLVRVLDGADPEPVSESRFGDVAAGEDAAPFVERLAALEVTSGCGDGSLFCPYDSVSRAQMAVFLYRAFDLPDADEPAGFTDVADDHWAADHIDALAASGITSGCRSEPWSFCPEGSVTKAEMAVFLFRALEWQQQDGEQQRWEYVTNPADPNPNNIAGYDPDVFYTEENDLSRYIKQEIVDRYAEDNPWLLETWNHTNRPDFTYAISNYTSQVSFLVEYADEAQPGKALDRRIARRLSTRRSKLSDRGPATSFTNWHMCTLYLTVQQQTPYPSLLHISISTS